MSTEEQRKVHFIDDSEKIVPAKDIQHVGEEGARRATALVDGKEVPIYNRVEWGFLWEEQEDLMSWRKRKDAFLNQVLEEMDGFDGVLLPQQFYDFIVGRDGSCCYSVDELESWLNDESEPEGAGDDRS